MMRRIKILLVLFLLMGIATELISQRSGSTVKKTASKKKKPVSKNKKTVSTKKKSVSKSAKTSGKNKKLPVKKGNIKSVAAKYTANTAGYATTTAASVDAADYASGKLSSKISNEGLSDTTDSRTVVITSEFKPSLQYAAKINFAAATAVLDTSRISLSYKVPSSNLFFNYQPIAIQPLAMPTDSGWIWENSHRVKIGAGNFNTVFAEGRFAFGDGKKSITTIQADFITSKGNEFAQQFSKVGLDVQSIINTTEQLEWTSHAFFNTITQYRYGFKPSTLVFTKDQLQQTYNTIALELGLKNKVKSAAGIDYHPQMSYYRFTDNYSGSENNLILKAPFEKSLGSILSLKLGVTADIASANFPAVKLTNNLFHINPSVLFTTPNLKLNIGIQPSWDNGAYSMQPDIWAEAGLPNTRLKMEAGWVGYFTKNSYRTLVAFNPWIGGLNSLTNTRIREQYVGIKGTAGNHLSFNGRVSFLKMNGQPLFLNDALDGKSFNTVFEPEMNTFRIHGELNYTVQENFSLMASTTISHYSGFALNTNSWGLIPFEITSGALWKPLKDLQLKADLFYRDGSMARNLLMESIKLPSSVDLSLGAEFSVKKQLNVWLQMNNLFNNTYQRWNQYPVFGFNVMAGVVYSFK